MWALIVTDLNETMKFVKRPKNCVNETLMRRGSSGCFKSYFLIFFIIFLFADFSLENGLNSKFCLHQDFWSLTILLEGWADDGELFVRVPPSGPRPCISLCIDLLSVPEMTLWCTHIFYNFTVFETHLYIFSKLAHDILLTSLQRSNA